MPKYSYKCLNKECEEIFEVVHSMKEKINVCSKCSGSVERVPSNIVSVFKKTKDQSNQKTGSLVKKSIKEFREALKEEKKRLSEVEYK